MTAEPTTETETAAAPALLTMAPSHQCAPRVLTRVYDGGRIGLVCPTCSEVVGYDDATYVTTLNQALEETSHLRAASVHLHAANEQLRTDLVQAQEAAAALPFADAALNRARERVEELEEREANAEPSDSEVADRWRTCSRAEAIRQAESNRAEILRLNAAVDNLHGQVRSLEDQLEAASDHFEVLWVGLDDALEGARRFHRESGKQGAAMVPVENIAGVLRRWREGVSNDATTEGGEGDGRDQV